MVFMILGCGLVVDAVQLVSPIATNVPAPGRIGLAYSNPYFDAEGIGGITARPEVADRIGEYLRRSKEREADRAIITNAFSGLTVSVQEGTSAQFYAEANLTGISWCSAIHSLRPSNPSPPSTLSLGNTRS